MYVNLGRKSSFFLEETEDIFARWVYDPQENQQVPQAPGALEARGRGGGGKGGGVGWGGERTPIWK